MLLEFVKYNTLSVSYSIELLAVINEVWGGSDDIKAIVIGNELDVPNSNPGQGCLFHFLLMPLGKS